jgi:hypothetical protein
VGCSRTGETGCDGWYVGVDWSGSAARIDDGASTDTDDRDASGELSGLNRPLFPGSLLLLLSDRVVISPDS